MYQNDSFCYSNDTLFLPKKVTFRIQNDAKSNLYVLSLKLILDGEKLVFCSTRYLFEINISKNDTCCTKMIPFVIQNDTLFRPKKRYLFKHKMMSFKFKKQPLLTLK